MLSEQAAKVLGELRAGNRTDEQLAEICADLLNADGLAVSLVLDMGHTELVWCHGTASAQFEDLQFTLGEGPGPDALASGHPVRVPDLAEVRPGRWPALLGALDGLPVRAVFAFPLGLGAIQVGVLTVVRNGPRALSAQETDDATALARLLTARFLGGGQGSNPQVLHRAVVHQATGMVSVQLDRPLAEALMRLRAYAYAHGRPITEVAQDVVARRLRFNDDETGPDVPVGDRG
ncbi:GAF domain-containing protein [Streptomyces xanthochromogenes]|uniref:GAF and ANTAR domain-containing protein n=1 Tax=Streptomyces xanthochromogenes TaxID=67384 RepID=UPI00167411CD|nr:GAF and ANTAR domain-containing protein [Streptomyces xanthochromogenes]GHB77555.1 GAF domain-containing protein [Streptomyces xanthochromogenes]